MFQLDNFNFIITVSLFKIRLTKIKQLMLNNFIYQNIKNFN